MDEKFMETHVQEIAERVGPIQFNDAISVYAAIKESKMYLHTEYLEGNKLLWFDKLPKGIEPSHHRLDVIGDTIHWSLYCPDVNGNGGHANIRTFTLSDNGGYVSSGHMERYLGSFRAFMNLHLLNKLK